MQRACLRVLVCMCERTCGHTGVCEWVAKEVTASNAEQVASNRCVNICASRARPLSETPG